MKHDPKVILFYFFKILLVENIAKTGGKMVIISNSSRRSSVTIEKVKSLGFDASLFLGAITSGELTHQYLQRYYYYLCFLAVFDFHHYHTLLCCI
jgi:ribonucleotide monophosphatase NagD (HAD superfamily)